MCIAAIAWDAHPDWLMILAGNRDEYHARPAAALAAWADDSAIIAGRDLEAGGTWLGISEAGRFALVTNFRAPGFPQPDRTSRGALVTDMLTGRAPEALDRYNPCSAARGLRAADKTFCSTPPPSSASPSGF